MKRVYCWRDRLLVIHLKNLIENEGIYCEIRNDYLAAGAGELPPTECWPELWVSEQDAERALELIADTMVADARHGKPWTCPSCHEQIEGQFAACWNCMTTRPDREI